MIPGATYRLQFHKGFPFEAARPLAPYLKRLGITHLYSSPILKARAGSMHGYDVTDPSTINPELGGEAALRSMAQAFRDHGIGILLDIVPNHMAVHADNAWWMDVLRNGQASAFADYFDIDWTMHDGKVLMPVLGKPYWETLQAGEVRVRADQRGNHCAWYFDKPFPLRPEDRHVEINTLGSPEALHALLERQHYRLAWWRTANDSINWRRFFDVSDLIALKQENEAVFSASHKKIFELYRDGLIDGVRVDHVDGLTDPARYCRQLRAKLEELAPPRPIADPHPYIVVEKILGDGEELPQDWGVDGTTGYDFMNQVSALEHAEAGAGPLRQLWHQIGGRPAEFETEEILARGEIVASAFESALSRTAQVFFQLSGQSVEWGDITAPSLRRALVHLLRHMRVYRTYHDGDKNGLTPAPQFGAAVAAASADASGGDRPAVEFIARALGTAGVGSDSKTHEAARHFNQLSAPVAAKAVEDTAFYRYGALLSRNDVGFNPGMFSQRAAAFHQEMERRASMFPHALLATATHDHKRGEDVRARLAVLSEIPSEWAVAVRSWFALNAHHRPPELDAGDEYQLYQTLVGAWPTTMSPADVAGLSAFANRVAACRQKALREAKLRSSWLDPNEGYEQTDDRFLRALLDPQRSAKFLSSLHAFVDRIGYCGAVNGLVQAVLRCTAPGVPDCYQGTESWDFSLVDPDNRRPVDYHARMQALQSGDPIKTLLRSWEDGRVKQRLIAELLRLRQERSELFTHGQYIPLQAQGTRAANIVSFARTLREDRVVVAAPLHMASVQAGSPAATFWEDTEIRTPPSLNGKNWRSLFSAGPIPAGPLRCSAIFEKFPVAVLV